MSVEILYDRKASIFKQRLTQLLDIAKEKERQATPLFHHIRGIIENYGLSQTDDNVMIVGSFGNRLQLPEIHENGVYCVEIDLLFERNGDHFHIPEKWNTLIERKDNPVYRTQAVSPNYESSLYVWLEIISGLEFKTPEPLSTTKDSSAIDNLDTKSDLLPQQEEHGADTQTEVTQGFKTSDLIGEELKSRSIAASNTAEASSHDQPEIDSDVNSDESEASDDEQFSSTSNLNVGHSALDIDEEKRTFFLTNRYMRDNIPSGKWAWKVSQINEEEEIDQGFYIRRPFRTYRTGQKIWTDTNSDPGERYTYFNLFDKVVGIKLQWPDITLPFFKRDRKWPPNLVMEKVKNGGCHVIPKTSMNDSCRDWKYTFAEAEQTIVKELTDMQRYLFMIFKQIKRRYLDVTELDDGNVGITSGLTTYHLKTIMLWVCEQRSPEEWESDPEGSMVALLDMLRDTLKTGFLSHFIIPEVNILPRLWRIWEREDKVLFMKEDFKPRLKDTMLHYLFQKVEDVLTHKDALFIADIMHDVDYGHTSAVKSRLTSGPLFGFKGFGDTF